MTIVEKEYTGLYEENGIRLICKMGKFTSPMTGKEIDICTNFVILENGEKVYSIGGDNNWMAYDNIDYISMSTYAEKVVSYWMHEKADIFWKKLFLDEFFYSSHTTKINIHYNNTIRRLKEEKRIADRIVLDEKLNALKERINDILPVAYTWNRLIIFNDEKAIPEKKRNFKDTAFYYDLKRIDENYELYKPYIVSDIELNDNESDIEILESILNNHIKE